jgi:hypothetical protein
MPPVRAFGVRQAERVRVLALEFGGQWLVISTVCKDPMVRQAPQQCRDPEAVHAQRAIEGSRGNDAVSKVGSHVSKAHAVDNAGIKSAVRHGQSGGWGDRRAAPSDSGWGTRPRRQKSSAGGDPLAPPLALLGFYKYKEMAIQLEEKLAEYEKKGRQASQTGKIYLQVAASVRATLEALRIPNPFAAGASSASSWQSGRPLGAASAAARARRSTVSWPMRMPSSPRSWPGWVRG